jgi:hypothetical protein
MEQQATTRTIARLPGCEAVVACRSGSLHCLCKDPDAKFRLLRIASHGAVEVLPLGSITADCSSVAVRPDGGALFTGHDSGEILMYSAPWANAPPEHVVSGQGHVSELRACQEG